MDLAAYSHDVIEGSDDDEATGKGDLAAETGPFGRNRFFQDLNQDVWLTTKYLIDLTGFDDLGFVLELAEICTIFRFIVNGEVGKFQ